MEEIVDRDLEERTENQVREDGLAWAFEIIFNFNISFLQKSHLINGNLLSPVWFTFNR